MSKPSLIVMRHAEARPAMPGEADFARTLTGFGTRDAERVGRWVKDQCPGIRRVLASPAARTRETVAAMFEADSLSTPELHWDPRLYLADLPQLLAVIAEENPSPLMVVGHNPGLEDLVAYLLGADEQQAIPLSLPTAGVYALELSVRKGPILPGSATQMAFTSPGRLAAAETSSTQR